MELGDFIRGSCIVVIAIAAVTVGASGPAAAANPADEHPIMKAMQYAETQWPDEFAGDWLDLDYWGEDHVFNGSEDSFAPDRKVFFAFTEGAGEKVAVLRAVFPAPNPYVAVDHEYSYKYLRGLQQQWGADVERFRRDELEVPGGRLDWYSSNVDVVANFMDVSMPGTMLTPEFLAWANDRYGPAVRFVEGEPIVPDVGGGPGMNDPGGKPGYGSRPGADRGAKRNRQLVRRCNRARKSSSAKKRRFSKSKKCRHARKQLA